MILPPRVQAQLTTHPDLPGILESISQSERRAPELYAGLTDRILENLDNGQNLETWGPYGVILICILLHGRTKGQTNA